MPERIGRALAYAVLIWLSGFVWGSVVFMTPATVWLAYFILLTVPWFTGRSLTSTENQ